MHERDRQRAAEALWSAWREQRTLASLFDGAEPAELRDGYLTQELLTALVGPTIGWKLAATSPEAQRSMGAEHPLIGRLYRRFSCLAPATLPIAHMSLCVVEAEFAVVLGADLPPRARSYSAQDVTAAVSEVRLAIEIPDSRLDGFPSAVSPVEITADAACSGLFSLGPAVAAWRDADLASQPLAILKDGVVAATGSGANVLSGPFEALAWLANHPLGDGLKQGEIVTTGSCTTPVPIAPGDEIVADFGPLGAVAASITAVAEQVDVREPVE